MNNDIKILFLREKALELTARMEGEKDDSMIVLWEAVLSNINSQYKKVPKQAFLELDREFERIIAYQTDNTKHAIHEHLNKKFGFTRLSETPEAILGRVLRRGKIVDEREAVAVRDALSGDFWDLPKKKILKLGSIMRAFEK